MRLKDTAAHSRMVCGMAPVPLKLAAIRVSTHTVAKVHQSQTLIKECNLKSLEVRWWNCHQHSRSQMSDDGGKMVHTSVGLHLAVVLVALWAPFTTSI